MDIFGRFARDPACMAAIEAADGGSWRSPFRPGVVYPYAPSGGGNFEEQAGLIVKTNVKTSNGYFERASSSSKWAVSTPLSLTGMAAAMTFVCRCKFVTAASGFQVAFGDGNPLSGNTANEGLHLTYWVTRNLIRANMRTTAGGALLSVTSPAAFLDKWVTYALVIDSATTSMKLYADGILIGSVVSANISQVIGGYTSKLKISSDIAGVAATALNQVKNLLVFDRTLSIGEIQLLR